MTLFLFQINQCSNSHTCANLWYSWNLLSQRDRGENNTTQGRRERAAPAQRRRGKTAPSTAKEGSNSTHQKRAGGEKRAPSKKNERVKHPGWRGAASASSLGCLSSPCGWCCHTILRGDEAAATAAFLLAVSLMVRSARGLLDRFLLNQIVRSRHAESSAAGPEYLATSLLRRTSTAQRAWWT